MKLIDLYYQWMELGTMGTDWLCGGGLCNEIPKEYMADLKLFNPKKPDKYGYNYWLCEVMYSTDSWRSIAFSFTPLRQAVVLLICAMHDEL